jgi:predicted ATPase/DNA-binding CsgD family transcriptional regulator
MEKRTAAFSPRLIVAPEFHLQAPLRRPIDPIIGREREVADIAAMLPRPDVRLLTLTGPGGVGKTRLALAAAAAVEDDFADGVAFVSLATIADAELVLPTIARALGLRDAGDRPLEEGVGAALRHRHLLLVVDTFEHVASGSPVVVDLLSTCPDLTIIATSREPLRVSGERRYQVPPLPIPTAESPTPAADLAGIAGVALFVDRAARARPGFALTEENAAAVAGICSRLDGLPLAIELAAAWLATLSPTSLLGRMEYRLPLLTRGHRDLPDRQRTMRDAIAWSYDLLSRDEQRFFREMAVFVGGFTLDAAERVGGRRSEVGSTRRQIDELVRPPTSVLDLIASLVSKNLLVDVAGEARDETEPRFTMLETVREFALERLAASGDEQEARGRHAAWCLTFGEESWQRLWRQPLRLSDLDRVEAEHDNMRAALAWFNDCGDGERALRLAVGLTPLWYLRSHRVEGLSWLQRSGALAATKSISPQLAARAAHSLGLLAESADDAVAAQLEALRLCRADDDRWGIAAALQSLVVIAIANGRNEDAVRYGEESLAIFESLGLPERISDLRCSLGRAAYSRGDLDRAHALLTSSLELARQCGDWFAIGQALNALAMISIDRGELDAAKELGREGLATWLEMGSKDGIANCLAGVATLATVQRKWEVAGRLFGAIAAMQILVGHETRVERVRHMRAEQEAVTRGGEKYVAAREASHDLRPEDAIAEATAYLGTPAESQEATDGVASQYGLTPRELEVLRLLAAGQSDREIADALFISRHTAMKHVANILGKLEVGSRGAAGALAHRRGLV